MAQIEDVLLIGGIIVLTAIGLIALTAGDIVSQLLSPVPSLAGPLGAAVALFIFVYLLGRLIIAILNNL